MTKELNTVLTYNDEELRQIAENFYREIKLSSEGVKTSLPFIINTLQDKDISRAQDEFQTMVIGGSFFKSALVSYKESEVIFLNKAESPLPVFKSKEGFLEFIDENLENDVDVLALNFAYPIEPILRDGKIDGILKSGTKEHVFAGLIGEKVGLAIEEYMKLKHNRSIIVFVANDAVCLLLSGTETGKRDSLAGGIVGTGLNFSFFLDEKRIVNLESGNFDKFPISKQAEMIDTASSSPGTGILEKELSGKYLFEHYNLIVNEECSGVDKIASTEEMSAIAQNDQHPGSALAKELFKKSAMLTAAQISGICKYKKADMNFIMEGSLFWKGYEYKEKVRQYVEFLSPDFKVNFTATEDSSLRGAAMLALL